MTNKAATRRAKITDIHETSLEGTGTAARDPRPELEGGAGTGVSRVVTMLTPPQLTEYIEEVFEEKFEALFEALYDKFLREHHWRHQLL